MLHRCNKSHSKAFFIVTLDGLEIFFGSNTTITIARKLNKWAESNEQINKWTVKKSHWNHIINHFKSFSFRQHTKCEENYVFSKCIFFCSFLFSLLLFVCHFFFVRRSLEPNAPKMLLRCWYFSIAFLHIFLAISFIISRFMKSKPKLWRSLAFASDETTIFHFSYYFFSLIPEGEAILMVVKVTTALAMYYTLISQKYTRTQFDNIKRFSFCTKIFFPFVLPLFPGIFALQLSVWQFIFSSPICFLLQLAPICFLSTSLFRFYSIRFNFFFSRLFVCFAFHAYNRTNMGVLSVRLSSLSKKAQQAMVMALAYTYTKLSYAIFIMEHHWRISETNAIYLFSDLLLSFVTTIIIFFSRSICVCFCVDLAQSLCVLRSPLALHTAPKCRNINNQRSFLMWEIFTYQCITSEQIKKSKLHSFFFIPLRFGYDGENICFWRQNNEICVQKNANERK